MVSRLTASSPAHPRRYASSREASLAGTRVTCALSTRLNATPRALSAAATCSAEVYCEKFAKSLLASAPPSTRLGSPILAASKPVPGPNSRLYSAWNLA